MSQPLIIASISIAVVDTAITDLRKNDTHQVPALRIVAGGVVVMVVLLALSDANEQVADSIAILILLATLIGPKGGAISTLLSKLIGADSIAALQAGGGVVQGAITGQNIASSKTVKQS